MTTTYKEDHFEHRVLNPRNCPRIRSYYFHFIDEKTEIESNQIIAKDRAWKRIHIHFLLPAILCKKEEEVTAEITNSSVMESYSRKRKKCLLLLSASRWNEQVKGDDKSQA